MSGPTNAARGIAALMVLLWSLGAPAGEADVTAAIATQAPDGSTRFSVTVRHGDEGWDHYADRWQVLAPDGTVLGTRRLLHPHVGEQPFTRSLSGVRIPDGIDRVTIRAGDKVHGLGGKTVTVDIKR